MLFNIPIYQLIYKLFWLQYILAALAEGAGALDIVAKEGGLDHAVNITTSNNLQVRYEALEVTDRRRKNTIESIIRLFPGLQKTLQRGGLT